MDIADHCSPKVLSEEKVVDNASDDLNKHKGEYHETENWMIHIELKLVVSQYVKYLHLIFAWGFTHNSVLLSKMNACTHCDDVYQGREELNASVYPDGILGVDQSEQD